MSEHAHDGTRKWFELPITTVAITFVGSFSFARCAGMTLERSAYLAVGMTAVSLTIHRFVSLARKYDAKIP